LINGFTLDTRMWDDQFQEFSKQYKVLRYDVRGYGQSATPSGEEYTDVDDLMILMKKLNIETAHIIGLSMGGSIAIDFTLSYPEAVNKLVLVDTTLNGYTWTEEYGSSLRSIWTTCKQQGLEAAKAQWLDFEIFCTESENPRARARLIHQRPNPPIAIRLQEQPELTLQRPVQLVNDTRHNPAKQRVPDAVHNPRGQR